MRMQKSLDRPIKVFLIQLAINTRFAGSKLKTSAFVSDLAIFMCRVEIRMLILLVLLLTHLVAGRLQCPQVSTSFGDDLDFAASFSVILHQPEGVVDDGNADNGGQCKLCDRACESCIAK